MQKIIGVMGAGEVNEEEKREAFELGKLLAESNWVLLTDKGIAPFLTHKKFKKFCCI